MLLYTWSMPTTKRGLQNLRRSLMLCFQMKVWQVFLFLCLATRLISLMQHRKTSFGIIWASPISPLAKERSTSQIPIFDPLKCSCAALCARWGMVKAFSGFPSTSSRVFVHLYFPFFLFSTSTVCSYIRRSFDFVSAFDDF